MALNKKRVRYPITGTAGAQVGNGWVSMNKYFVSNEEALNGATASAQAGSSSPWHYPRFVRYPNPKYRKTGR